MRLFAIIAVIFVALCATSSAFADSDVRNSFPKQYSMNPKGVNLQTGRFHYSKADISIGDLQFVRQWGDVPSFTSTARSIGALATYVTDIQSGWTSANVGWSNNFNEGVAYSDYSSAFPRVYVVVGGQIFNFVVLNDGSVAPSDQSSQGTMLAGTAGGAQWQFTDRGGTIYTFYAHAALSQHGAPGTPFQLLQSVVRPDGSRLDYSYNAAAQPHFIKSSKGYAIAIDYDANGNVSAACGFNLAQLYADASSNCASATLKASYTYDVAGRNLTSVTDVSGRVVTMTYVTPAVGFSYLTCLSQPNSSICEISNVYGPQPGDGTTPTADDQVRVQTTAAGVVWVESYRGQPDPADQPPVVGQPRYSISRMTDPAGGIYFLKFDRGHLTVQTTPAGTTNFRYRYRQISIGVSDPTYLQYHDNLPGLMILPEGNMEYFVHDNRGNLTRHSYWPKGAANAAAPGAPNLSDCCITPDPVTDPAGSVSFSQTFPADFGVTSAQGNIFVLGCGSGPADAKLCNKPLTATDANGNITDYTYDQATGNVLTETAPAVNGVRAQTRYTYAQRYAWVKNASGGYTQGTAPVWVLTQTSLCKSGAVSGGGCATAGDEVRTTYDYGPDSGPNNLLLRGVVNDAAGAALRTCYAYDAQGNKLSETKPRAGLTVCP